MIRAKGCRKISVLGRNYFWYVLSGEYDWSTPFLHIVSEDKQLILAIPLNAPKPYALSKGREFQSKPTGGSEKRYFLPLNLP